VVSEAAEKLDNYPFSIKISSCPTHPNIQLRSRLHGGERQAAIPTICVDDLRLCGASSRLYNNTIKSRSILLSLSDDLFIPIELSYSEVRSRKSKSVKLQILLVSFFWDPHVTTRLKTVNTSTRITFYDLYFPWVSF
jgi:hypothetical protein